MKKVAFLLMLFVLPALGQVSNNSESEIQKFRVAVQGGYAYRLGKVSEDLAPIFRDYTKSLKSGYTFGMDASYFLGSNHGLGIKYSRYNSQQSLNNMEVQFINGDIAQGTISDRILIDFVGPSYVNKYEFNNKHSFVGSLSLGYLGYRDEGLLVDRIMNIKGSTFGAAVDLGYDFEISKYFTLGAQIGVTGGSLSELKINDGFSESTITLEEESMENLSRLDIGAGIRFKI